MDARLPLIALIAGCRAAMAGPGEHGPSDSTADRSVDNRGIELRAPSVEFAAQVAERRPSWTFQIEPDLWYMAPAGKLRMPGGATSGNKVEFSVLNLDSPRLSPYFEVHVRRDRWRASVSGAFFSESDRGADIVEPAQFGKLDLAPGDRIKSSLDFWTAEAVGAYRFIDRSWNPDEQGNDRLAIALDGIVGARVFSADFSFERSRDLGGGSTDLAANSHDGIWIHPIVGAKLDVELFRDWTIDVQSTLGSQPFGRSYSTSWDIQVNGTWRPHPNVGVQLGFRIMVLDFHSGSGNDRFSWRGSTAGLFTGVEFRF